MEVRQGTTLQHERRSFPKHVMGVSRFGAESHARGHNKRPVTFKGHAHAPVSSITIATERKPKWASTRPRAVLSARPAAALAPTEQKRDDDFRRFFARVAKMSVECSDVASTCPLLHPLRGARGARGMLRHGAHRFATAARVPPPTAAANKPPVCFQTASWIDGGVSTSTRTGFVPGPRTAFTNVHLTQSRSFASQQSSSEASMAAARARSIRAARIASSTASAQGSANTGGIYLLALTVGMVGATYASVPLYRIFCQATGFGGTTRRKTIEDKLKESESLPIKSKEAALSREVTISFNADVADGMPWRFTPTQKNVKVRPGETTLAFFTAKNKSSSPVTGVATYNVQPNKAGSYFNKVQCFCFEEQRLRAGEEVDMPVFFYLDPEFASDGKFLFFFFVP